MNQPANLSAGADRAFPSHPRLDRYFPSSSSEEARTRLMSCIERGEGPAVLIGASGAGKTMLLEVLAEAFADRFAIAHLSSTQLCTRRALLQAILHGLGQPHRDHEEGDLRLALVDFLQDESECPAGALLLVDEAQSLAPRLLEELRVLGNLARQGQPLVRMVLTGSTQLEECLASTELETLNQRIAARCYLAPLTYEELSQYIRGHIAAAGADPDDLLGIDAAAAVFEATDGIPRLVNQLCDRAIVLAVEAGADRIDRSAIQNAWSDLHQLPAPWHSPEASVPAEIAPVMESFEPLAEIATAVEFDESLAAPEPLWNADAALAEVITTTPQAEEPLVVEAIAEALPEHEPTVEPVAADPFGDDFDEEELVLDRFVVADSPFPPGTPLVINQSDDNISDMIATLTPSVVDSEEGLVAEEVEVSMDTLSAEPVVHEPVAVESFAEELIADEPVAATESSAAEPEMVGLPFPVDEADATETELDEDEDDEIVEVSVMDTSTDPAVLVIEEEAAPESISLVRRQEYRQLFASLRGG